MTRIPIPADNVREASRVTLSKLLCLNEGDQVLILANPSEELEQVAGALFETALELGGRPVLIYQATRGKLDIVEPSTLNALKADPEIAISLTVESIGIDYEALKNSYKIEDTLYDHYFYYLLGRKKMRAAWCPNLTAEIFARCVLIDYEKLWERSRRMKTVLDRANFLYVATPAGTELEIGIAGRKGLKDDGDYREPGLGGNLPAGEIFISPALEAVNGIAVADGSMGLDQGVLHGSQPIEMVIKNGYIDTISNNDSGRMLTECLERSRSRIIEMATKGQLSREREAEYLRYNNHIGEFGLGLNPAARIIGNMIEDEKALNTCHIAIGNNYDGDGSSLMHLDAVMKDPEVIARFPDGSEELLWPVWDDRE